MKRAWLIFVVAAAALLAAAAPEAQALHCREKSCCLFHSGQWHGCYYYTPYGMPTALVVPPTAEAQTHWGWGVGNFQVTSICPQFRRDWPGPGCYDCRGLLPTPRWPSHTDQFGVYYVRGPW